MDLFNKMNAVVRIRLDGELQVGMGSAKMENGGAAWRDGMGNAMDGGVMEIWRMEKLRNGPVDCEEVSVNFDPKIGFLGQQNSIQVQEPPVQVGPFLLRTSPAQAGNLPVAGLLAGHSHRKSQSCGRCSNEGQPVDKGMRPDCSPPRVAPCHPLPIR